ncbi:PREDICTED: lipopolysaccharide-binding protein-like [Elephantulus edwardii]|uniref:lipopolysaccharide-binding protein-like n=1 Tax=Elephantulus edwardii TaxID=28737 RepID=UPI0003F0A5FA|nr:PREDICTED: lipopolysaccharide-binding protein-like [Elephantulus edwardii]
MLARPYWVVVVLLLLAGVSRFGEGASNPGIVARITRSGLDYARHYGVAILKKELAGIAVPDFVGKFKSGWLGSVSYEFHRLKIQHFELRNSELSLLPGQGVRASLSNNYVSVSGNWKVKKAFVTLEGTFDLRVDGISISVSLKLGKDDFGRPTASVADCRNSIGHVSIYISGHLEWLLNLFHKKIENKFKEIMQEKICNIVQRSTTGHLMPYLQTLPVTSMIDQFASIDYRLAEAPLVVSQGLDTFFKGEFFSQKWRSPVPFDAPAIKLSQEDDHMVYFAVSEYVFNTASQVYHQAGRMNFTFQNKHIPLDSQIHLNTNSFRTIIPRLGRLYPNMEIELQTSPESAPFLMFSPGNITFMPVMDVQAFVLLPNSTERKPLFQLRARTNISVTINVTSNRIVGFVTPGSELKLELKHSNVGSFNVQLMEAILNIYTLYTIYPYFNGHQQPEITFEYRGGRGQDSPEGALELGNSHSQGESIPTAASTPYRDHTTSRQEESLPA